LQQSLQLPTFAIEIENRYRAKLLRPINIPLSIKAIAWFYIFCVIATNKGSEHSFLLPSCP
jgi:hypothetical protein